jgi:hypothetical protein
MLLRETRRPIFKASTGWGLAASGLLAGTAWLITTSERHASGAPWRAVRSVLQVLLVFVMFVYAAYRLRRERDHDD